jgi:hypothetical protein
MTQLFSEKILDFYKILEARTVFHFIFKENGKSEAVFPQALEDFTKQFLLFKQDKLVSVLTCSMHMHCWHIEKNNAQFTYATKIISFAIKK